MERMRKLSASPLARQSLVISGLFCGFFCAGLCFGNPTVMIPQLKHENAAMQVNMNLATWLNSIQGISSLVSLLYIPALMQAKGRKVAFVATTLPTLISWIVIYFAQHTTQLLIGRFLQGLSVGGLLCLGLIGIAEYSEPKHRGVFLVLKSGSLYWGIWVANALGTAFYWRTAVLIMLVPSTYSVVSPLMWPESPTWLASKGHFDRCAKSLYWLRGRDASVDAELNELVKTHTVRLNNERRRRVTLMRKLKETVTSTNFYKPMFTSMVLFLQFYACGKLVHASYAITIIEDISSSESTAVMGMLIIDGVTVVCMYLGCFLAKRFRRRTLLFTTCTAAILILIVLAIYLYLIECKVISENTPVTLMLLIMFSITTSLGPTTLPTAIYGEIMPSEHKGLCTMIVSAYSGLLQFAFLKSSPYMFKAIGLHSSFLVFAAITTVCLIYLYIYMPETKDKTLQEIEDIFKTKGDHKNHKKETELLCMKQEKC